MTPGESNCPVEGEPDVVVTSAGTWVGYNDDHDCLYPGLSDLQRLTSVQLLPVKGTPKLVRLELLHPDDFYAGDPALTADPKVPGGVLLATMYVHRNGGTTIEVLRISPSLKVTRLPSPATHNGPSNNADKEFITADTNPKSRYRGRIYLAWDDFNVGRTVLRAFDGRKWSLATIHSATGKPDVAVAPNGDVAVVYETGTGVAVRISKNGGATFGEPVTAITGGEPGRSDPSCPLRPVVGTRQRATKAVRATYDPLGRLHVVAAVNPATLPSAGVATGGASAVVHAVTANGRDFQTMQIGQSTAVRFHPAVATTPQGGVAVAWLQVTDATATAYEAYVTVAPRGTRSFVPPVKVSSAPATFPSAMEAMLNSNCYGIGDYIGLATSPRGVVVAWPTTDESTRPQVDSDVLVREAIVK